MSTLTAAAPRLFAVFLGLTVPSLFFGRVVLAIMVGLAMICLLLSEDRLDHWRRGLQRVHSPLGYLIVITFVGWLPNTLVSIDPLRSFEAAARTLLILGLFTGVRSALNDDRRLIDIALKALIAMSVITTAIAVLSMTVWPELYWVLKLRGVQSTRVFIEMKPFAALSVLLIPVLLWTVFRFPLKWSLPSGLAVAGLLAVVWMSYDRAAMAGLVGAVICLCIAVVSRGRSLKRALPMIAITIVLIVITVLWLKANRMNVGGPDGDWMVPIWLIDFERQTMWRYAWELMQQSPWIGLGINTINLLPGADAIMLGTERLQMIPGHPHNWLIEVLAETGVVGLFPLLAIIGVSFLTALQRYRIHAAKGALVAITVFGGYWGSGLFNFSFWSVWWQVSFFLIVTISLSLDTEKDRDFRPHSAS